MGLVAWIEGIWQRVRGREAPRDSLADGVIITTGQMPAQQMEIFVDGKSQGVFPVERDAAEWTVTFAPKAAGQVSSKVV